MKKENFLMFKEFFNNYVKNFYSSDEIIHENIILKEEHTYRVLDAVERISEELALDDEKKMIARTTALFHDIGRFYQFKKYKTFDDRISENHGELSSRILIEENVLETLEEDERNLILKVIEYHNSYKLPEGKTEDFYLFSKILRDGDKFDIFKVLTDYYENMDKESKPVLEYHLSDAEEYSAEVIDDIINYRNSDKSILKTKFDMRLFVLTWIFDVNYSVTLRMISERKYIEKILNTLPLNSDMKMVENSIYSYMSARI